MHLLFLTNFYPPHELGGYSQICHEVTDALRARGHDVRILTSRHRRDGVTTPAESHVERRLHLEADIDYYRPGRFFRDRARERRENVEALDAALAREPEAILVWGMWNLSTELAARLEAHAPERVAYFISSYWPVDPDPHHAYWSLPANRTLTEGVKRLLRPLAAARLRREGYPPRLRFERARCCSRYVRDTLVEAGALPESAEVLYLGIDPTRYTPPAPREIDERLRLLYFGRLVEDKGVHTAVEALGRLQAAGEAEGVALTILGSGHPAYERRLRALVTRLGLAEIVRFLPQLPRHEVPALLADHDLYLFTSIWPEPLARSVMEAMAAELLVVGARVGGQQEMLEEGVNALTFEAGDDAELARQLARARRDGSLRQRLARAGRQTVESRFQASRMIDEFEGFMQTVVGTPA